MVEPDILRLGLFEPAEMPFADRPGDVSSLFELLRQRRLRIDPAAARAFAGSIGRNMPVRIGSRPVMMVARVGVLQGWE